MATRLNPTNFGYQNFYSTTLTGDITAGTLTIGLATVPTPTSGVLIIEPDSTSSREVIVYTSKGASTITCPSDGRGYSGTSAAAHLTGSTVIMAPVDKWFTALASGELSTDPLRTELFYDYVASGMVWSGDAYASTRNASMTSGVIYIGGRRLTAATVSARSFTASKDTYIDASDNGDGTALLTYTEVANNAASPALAANNVRIGIIVTGASNIAAAGSVNQGQEGRVLPIASSIPYCFTDSLGNIICPRDPLRKIIGYRQIVADSASLPAASFTDVIGLSVPFIADGVRKVRTRWVTNQYLSGSADGSGQSLLIRESSTTLATASYVNAGVNFTHQVIPEAVITPTAGLHTYKSTAAPGGAAMVVKAGTGAASFLIVEQI